MWLRVPHPKIMLNVGCSFWPGWYKRTIYLSYTENQKERPKRATTKSNQNTNPNVFLASEGHSLSILTGKWVFKGQILSHLECKKCNFDT